MLNAGSVFSGIGLLDYGLHLAGIRHRWLCEWDPWRRSVLARRWPGVRVLDDVRHVGHGCEPVELVAGGFPCKGASTAGPRNGFDHPETVLWREMFRGIRELGPRYVLVENVANILAIRDGEVWAEVLRDLASLGLDVVWDCVPAAAVGAPHLRDRVFAVAAHAHGELRQTRSTDAREERAGRRAPGGGAGAPTDAAGLEAPHPAGDPGGRDHTRRDAAVSGREAAADAGRGGLREQPEPERGRCGASLAALTGATPADTHERELSAGRHGGGADRVQADSRSVAVEWGDYWPAIRRWEAIHGPAPEPLVRRMDDRTAARLERSRLSALGDGVQVQVGRIAGEYIVGLERARRGGVT